MAKTATGKMATVMGKTEMVTATETAAMGMVTGKMAMVQAMAEMVTVMEMEKMATGKTETATETVMAMAMVKMETEMGMVTAKSSSMAAARFGSTASRPVTR